MKNIKKSNVGVSKSVLIFMAGFIWASVGTMLIILAHSWLSPELSSTSLKYAGIGVGLALMIHHFGFLKITDKNLRRILSMKEKKSIFSFISWKSYLLIPLMIAMGAILRHSKIPNQYLAIVYIGMGLALFLSSIRYMRFFIKEVRK